MWQEPEHARTQKHACAATAGQARSTTSAHILASDLSVRPDLQTLNGKFPLSLNQIQQPRIGLLSTDRGPTADEQAALSLYDQLHRSCVKAQANWLLDATYGMMPEAVSMQQKMFASEQNHLAASYQGKGNVCPVQEVS
jgi:hypothetical protein